jgi:glycosyltransferase involved in cell wall biosynthesis
MSGLMGKGGLLLELPAPFRRMNGALYFEAQAVNGLRLWMENFDHLTLCAPLIPEDLIDSSVRWICLDELLASGRLTLFVLPWAYAPKQHLFSYSKVRKFFRKEIPRHKYLLFCNLGWVGAWGNVAASEAKSAKRPYGVWLDWVLHDMQAECRGIGVKAVWRRVARFMVKRKSLWAIRASSLGLFHGRTVYDAYSPYSINPQLVHDIHLGKKDIVSATILKSRLSAPKKIIKVAYVGRVHPMKDPMAWIDVVRRIVDLSQGTFDIDARWLGDGPMLDECRNRVMELGMDSFINFLGNEPDRERVVSFLRSSDVFLFCHVTPESPRCLIEALMSGLPLIGFESRYASDLVALHGGGTFTPIGAISELASILCGVINVPGRLEALTIAAYESGKDFSDEAVFKHRSDLIKQYL